MRAGNSWFTGSGSENDEDYSNTSVEESTTETEVPQPVTPSRAESSSSDEFVHIEAPAPSLETVVSLLKSRVDRLRSDVALFNEKLERGRLMQQLIMRAVVDQGVTQQTKRAYTIIYLVDDRLGPNRNDIARLDGLALMGFLTISRDLLSKTKVYPMGIGCEEREYSSGEITLDYNKDDQELSMTASLVRDQYGDYVIDFSSNVWPDDDLDQIEFCFSKTLQLVADA